MPDITTPGMSLDVCVYRRGRIIKKEFFDLKRGNSDTGWLLTLLADDGTTFQLVASTDSRSDIRQWDYAPNFPENKGVKWKSSEENTVCVVQNSSDEMTRFVDKNETFQYRRHWIPEKIATMLKVYLSS
jgi:hypothetical protein